MLASPFVARWASRLRPLFQADARALDLAAGRGRHSLVLAEAGFRVTAVDIRLEALRETRQALHDRGLDGALLCTDLTTWPLPWDRFEAIVVSRYLDRLRIADLQRALVPGGVLVYETFTERQLSRGRGPRSPEHLLAPGELRLRAVGMDVLFDEEVTEPEAVARVVARKRAAP